MLLKGKTAVITGSNKGIGLSTLKALSENGANIFACVRNIDDEFNKEIELIKEKFSNEIFPISLDLSDENKIKEATTKILNFNKKIEILINNAGAIDTSLFQMTTKKQLKELFDINFFSQSFFTQSILKSLTKSSEGSIIYISSTSALDANEGRSSYSATKAAIIAQAKVLSRELGRYNIRVNVIAPGLIDTNMMKNNHSEAVIKDIVSRTSLKKIGSPEDVANVVVFLSSKLSSHITGQVIRVDGGL